MRSARFRAVSSCTLALGLMSGHVPIAGAQTLPAPEADQNRYVQLEGIVMTARKVEERLQDTPVSVSVVTAKDIEDHGLTSIDDIARFVPGVNYESQIGRLDANNTTSIRGVSGLSSGGLSFKPFANFIDGIYVRGSLADFDLSDVERVEVLRGPQSALYGRATESGLINYITRKPTEDLEGSVSVTAGQYGYQRYSGRVSGPIAPGLLSFSANVSYYQRDGFYTNLFDGQRDDSQQTKAGSVSLRLTPGDDFDATLRYGYIRTDDGMPAEGYQGSQAGNCGFLTGDPATSYPYYCGHIHPAGTVNLYTGPLQPIPGYVDSTDRLSLLANYHFGEFTLTSVTGYDNNHVKIGLDRSFTAYIVPDSVLPGGGDSYQSAQVIDSHSLSQELRLVSPRGQPLRYQVGASWYYETNGEHELTGLAYDQAVLGLSTYNAYTASVHNVGAFAQVEYDFVPELTLSGEIRYQADDIRYDQPPAGYRNQQTYDSVTGRLVLSYKVTDGTMLYASAATGTKPGGFNSVAADPTVPQGFAEERIYGGEIGIKSQPVTQLTLDADIYFDRISNLQTMLTAPAATGSSSYIGNASSATTKGIELEAAYRLSSMFSVHATYSYNIAEFLNYPGFADLCNLAGQFTPVMYVGAVPLNSCLTGPVGNAAGRTLPNAPRNMASLQADLTIPLGPIRFFVRPQISYRSNVWDEAENLAGTGERKILDARIGIEAGTWSVAAFGTNLLGNDNPVSILRYIDPTNLVTMPRAFAYSLPDKRMVGAEVRVSF